MTDQVTTALTSLLAALDQLEFDSDEYSIACWQIWNFLTNAEKETLICVTYSGPVSSGGLPSKNARNLLVRAGLCCATLINGSAGYWTGCGYALDIVSHGHGPNTLDRRWKEVRP